MKTRKQHLPARPKPIMRRAINAKKFNGLGLTSILMVCGGLAMWIGSPTEALSCLSQFKMSFFFPRLKCLFLRQFILLRNWL
ncbi:TPA: hypothetical protein I7146_09865 [Vibrio vulnificus]|nr:hypothetical protein [Vibrio vulnificus]